METPHKTRHDCVTVPRVGVVFGEAAAERQQEWGTAEDKSHVRLPSFDERYEYMREGQTCRVVLCSLLPQKWYARRESNAQPPASEAGTLSN